MPLTSRAAGLLWAVPALTALTALAAPARVLTAQSSYVPPAENLAARARFQEMRFGMFIHWGLYSLLQDGEWVMNNRGLTVPEYETLAPQFNPVKFDAAEWVRLAKDAGMRYVTITSKHHDGFAMFDSKVSDWDIVDRTPYGRDVLKLLAHETRAQGVALFFYHSQLDWHHPDYWPRGQTGQRTGRAEQGDWYRYLDYMDAQLRELLTHYGPIGGIWFDGMWDRYEADWRLERTYGMIHELQPAALIGSNHHRLPYPGEDFQMFEKDLPGQNTFGYNTTEIGALPLETCETANDSWGYRLTDRNLKNRDDLIRLLVNAAGRDANLLLNVGPMPTGEIPPAVAARLREVGAWLAVYGEAIYGTRGGPIPPRPWGVTTQKGDRVYVHVLDWTDRDLTLPPLAGRVRSARMLDGGAAVPVRTTGTGVTLTLPAADAAMPDRVVVLEVEG
jgi:alpha-L-fucosidase